jgi:TIR domain
MAKIFHSYRRQDSAGVTGRIFDRLRAHFVDNAVFMDIDSIPFGEDFREHIDAAVGQADLVLAVIGPRWSGKTEASRRIDDPRYFVRIEIESALQRGITVIPVLLDRTRMPTEAAVPPSLANMTFRKAIEVDQGRDFHPHVDRLIRAIEFHFQRLKFAGTRPPSQASKPAPKPLLAKERAAAYSNRQIQDFSPEREATPPKRRNLIRPGFVVAALLLLSFVYLISSIPTARGTAKIMGTDKIMTVLIDDTEIQADRIGEPIPLRTGQHFYCGAARWSNAFVPVVRDPHW